MYVTSSSIRQYSVSRQYIVSRGWSSIIRTDVFSAGAYIFAQRASWYGKKSFIIKLSLKWGIVRLCSLNNTRATDQKVLSFKMQFSWFCKNYILVKWRWIFSTMELTKMIFFTSNFMWFLIQKTCKKFGSNISKIVDFFLLSNFW